MTDKRRSDTRKILNSLAIAVGVLLLAGAVGIVIAKADLSKKQSAEQIVSAMNAMIPPQKRALPEAHYGHDMPSAEIGGENFVGLLEIEQFGRTLPVGSGWNEKNAGRFPMTYAGNIYNRDLIIGGDSRDGQFDFADTIEIGHTVIFTDLYGRIFRYEVTMVNHAESTDSITSGEDDLTLFARSRNTSKYVIIRCRLSNM
ncbi:MAG: hypothetical protein IJM51_06270 [Clostridia bacterium]|nr:hypothetical protein [Clostridia bacterium]